MGRSRIKPFVIVSAAVSVAIGLPTLLLPIRMSHGAGSLRCEDFGADGSCPTEPLVDRLAGAGVLVAALIAPTLALFALAGEGRRRPIARAAWVIFLGVYWAAVVIIGLLMLTAADDVAPDPSDTTGRDATGVLKGRRKVLLVTPGLR